MADPEDKKLDLPEDVTTAIDAVSEGPRAWILRHMEGIDTSEEVNGGIDKIRRRARWLVKAAEMFGQLDEASRSEGMHNLIEDVESIGRLEGEFDLKSFPNYKKLVAGAVMSCLAHSESTNAPRSAWIWNAITIKSSLGRGLTFSDTEISGYSDAWKAAFVYGMEGNQKLAIAIANMVQGEVNLKEIPNYEELVKNRYYQLMLRCHDNEDQALKDTLGGEIDFTERDGKIVERMGECLNDVRNLTVIDILYILKKFDEVHFGSDNIENFEQGVRAAFLLSLKEGNLGVGAAKLIKERLGEGMSFDDEVRAGITYKLDSYQHNQIYSLESATNIRDELGSGIDLSVDLKCQRSVVGICMKLLAPSAWRVKFVVSIKNKLGAGMNFSDETVPGYTKAIQDAFLVRLQEGNLEEADMIKRKFGDGVSLDADLSGYSDAANDGFVSLVNGIDIEGAKDLISEFGVGVEIDTVKIVQNKFVDLLKNNEWSDAVKIKQGFEPEIMCDRTNIADYDEAFCVCFAGSFDNGITSVSESEKLYAALGQGVDIVPILREIKDEKPLKFIRFAKKDHWKGVFGDAVIERFLEALPKRNDEKRNAFTHNEYDRTSQFIEFLCNNGNLRLDDTGFAVMTDFVAKFGLCRAQNLYKCFQSLREGSAVEGIESIEDLEERVRTLRAKIYSEEPVTDLSDLSGVEIDLLAFVTGKHTHRFDSGRHKIEDIISDFQSANEAGEIAEVPNEYKVESMEVPEISIDFDPETVRADYSVLKKEIIESVEDPTNVSPLISKSLVIVDEKLAIFRRSGENQAIGEQIVKTEAVRRRIEQAESLDDLMTILLETRFMGKKNPFYSVMRQIVFRKIFAKNRSPEALADTLARLSAEQISGHNVLEVIGIVDDMVKNHVLNLGNNNKDDYWTKETWDKLCASVDNTSLVEVLKIFSPHITNLKDAAKKFKLTDTGKTATVRSIPDRGFVGEMSGYLADVCYTAEYPLLKPRPNLVPHKLVVGDGQEAEFFGSYLIFELEADDSEKVMLVRGFNVPQEASIDVVKFIENTFDKLEATARERGMTKIVVPGVMEALTNYPMTKSYLYNRYINKREPIKLKERFAFNGYDLTEKCFVARNVSQPELEVTTPEMPVQHQNRPEAPPAAMSA